MTKTSNNGNPSFMEALSQNAWLRMVERVAIPVLTFLIWQQWQTVQELEKQAPLINLRIDQLETALKNSSVAFSEATKERNANQLVIVSTVAEIRGDIHELQSDVTDIKARVNRIPVPLQHEGSLQ
jgi:uncharacterized protein YfaP (DUF2135 family)